MPVDLNGGRSGGEGGGGGGGCGGGSGGGGGVIIVVVIVVVGVRGGDVDAGKAFQRGKESGRDGGAEPHGRLVDLLPRYDTVVVLHRRRPIRS